MKQITFNENNEVESKEKGEIIFEGNAYLEKIDFNNKYVIIDIGDIICYIKNAQEDSDDFYTEYDD